MTFLTLVEGFLLISVFLWTHPLMLIISEDDAHQRDTALQFSQQRRDSQPGVYPFPAGLCLISAGNSW